MCLYVSEISQRGLYCTRHDPNDLSVCVCMHPTPKWCFIIPAQGARRVNYANKAEHLFFLCIMYVTHDEPEKALYS